MLALARSRTVRQHPTWGAAWWASLHTSTAADEALLHYEVSTAAAGGAGAAAAPATIQPPLTMLVVHGLLGRSEAAAAAAAFLCVARHVVSHGSAAGCPRGDGLRWEPPAVSLLLMPPIPPVVPGAPCSHVGLAGPPPPLLHPSTSPPLDSSIPPPPPPLPGTGRNLRTITNSLIQEAARQTGRSWQAVLVDQRCHGKSARLGHHPPHTLAASAHDLVALFRRAFHQGPDVVVGHSLGGKVTLELLCQLAAPGSPLAPPAQAWVLDAQPGAVPSWALAGGGATADVLRVLQQVASIPTPIPSRPWLYQQLEERGFSKGLQQWLGGSLVPAAPPTAAAAPSGASAAATSSSSGDGSSSSAAPCSSGGDGFQWAFDLGGAEAMFHDYLRRDYWKQLEAPPAGTSLHIVRALQSDRWDHHTIQRLRAVAEASAAAAAAGQAGARAGGRAGGGAGRMLYHEVPKAGHWLHVDNPKGLLAVMLPSLVQVAADRPAA